MTTRMRIRVLGVLFAWAGMAGIVGVLAATTARAQDAEAPMAEEMEALGAGSVHEAFAEPVVFDPAPGVVVNKEPPEAIEELPPDTKPEGENITWIPGYWNWDDERDNFVWTSGFWREIPPGREWVPGYWTKAPDGWQWVAGYWASTEVEEVDYLPPPPKTLEVGPSTPAPSTDQLWVPGVWMWRDVRYVWRPGYWVVGRPNWMWVPAHYVWTPGGFVFVDGYWDLPVARRGMLFAPVAFRSPIYMQPGYRYSPSVVINLSLFTNHLFVRPSWGCYYFGDYYAAQYSNRGYYPWHTFHSGHHGYDPIYVHNHFQQVHVHQNANWANNLQRDYTRHVDQVALRPARSFSTTTAIAAGVGAGAGLGLVATLNQVQQQRDPQVKLQKVDEAKRQEFANLSKETRDFTRHREKLERDAGGAVGAREGRPIRTDSDKIGAKDVAAKDAVGKVVGPKLEGPKVDAAKGNANPGQPGDSDSRVRKVTRGRPPVVDRDSKETAVAREVPARLEHPKAKIGDAAIGAKGDDAPTGRGKTGAPAGSKAKLDGDDDGKPNVVPRAAPGKGRPKDTPRVDTPRGTPKVDIPKTDTPKPTPKIDSPKPKAEAPRTAPRTETPKPKAGAPRAAPRTETPKPKAEAPRAAPRPAPPKPRSDPPSTPPRAKDPPKSEPKQPRGKDRKGNSASLFDGSANGQTRSVSGGNANAPLASRSSPRTEARTNNSRPEARAEPRVNRAEPRVEPRASRADARPTRAADDAISNRGGNDDRRRDRKK